MTDPALPTYTDLMLPTLKAVAQVGGSGPYQAIDEAAVDIGDVTEEQLAVEYGPESTQQGSKVLHRVAWARSLLKRIGALESVSYGVWGITDKGLAFLDLPDEEADSELRAELPAAFAGVEPTDSQYTEWRQLASAGTPAKMAARELISLWGARRRWASANSRIKSDLLDHELTTEPDFTSGGLDEEIAIVAVAVTTEIEPATAKAAIDATAVTLTVGNIPSASTEVLSVHPNVDLIKAQTLMRANDFSQLAVTETKYRLVGAISWESIARASMRNPDPTLDDCLMRSPRVVTREAPLLDAVPDIAAAGFVFVREKGAISGIVTTADLSEEFASRSRPFLLVGEIEQWLRFAIDQHFQPDEIVEYLDPDDAEREVEGAHSLTLGEVQWLLQTPGAWERLGWPDDQKVFIDSLDQVRRIRNEIMHFSPDPLTSDDLRRLTNFLSWLRDLVPASQG